MTGDVGLEATVSRRQKKKKKKTYVRGEVAAQSIETHFRVKKVILFRWDTKLVQREDECQAAMGGHQTRLITRPGVEKFLGYSVTVEVHVLEDRETDGLFLRDQGTIGAGVTARMVHRPSLGRGEQDDRYAEGEGAHLPWAGTWLAVRKRLGQNPASDGALRMARCAGGHLVAKRRRKRARIAGTSFSSEASGSSSSGSSTSGLSYTVPSYESNADVKREWRSRRSPREGHVKVCVLTGSLLAHGRVPCCVRVESGRLIDPRRRFAGGEFAGLPILWLTSAR